MVIPGHNLGNSQVSVNRTIGPTLVGRFPFRFEGGDWVLIAYLIIAYLLLFAVRQQTYDTYTSVFAFTDSRKRYNCSRKWPYF